MLGLLTRILSSAMIPEEAQNNNKKGLFFLPTTLRVHVVSAPQWLLERVA